MQCLQGQPHGNRIGIIRIVDEPSLAQSQDLPTAVGKADLVIESVPEVPEVKTSIYRKIAPLLRRGTEGLNDGADQIDRDVIELRTACRAGFVEQNVAAPRRPVTAAPAWRPVRDEPALRIQRTDPRLALAARIQVSEWPATNNVARLLGDEPPCLGAKCLVGAVGSEIHRPESAAA